MSRDIDRIGRWVSVYHLGNFGTARTKLKGWELKS
jgi:hypothetical protein